MKRVLHIVILLLVVAASFGQDVSKNQADSLTKLLGSRQADKDLLDIYFRLAQYHMFKPGGDAADLDSAKRYMDLAGALNAKLRSVDAHGFLVLLRSQYAKEKGQEKEAKPMAENAVSILENGKNKYYLGRAYFALSEYYDYRNPNENNEKIRLVELAVKAFQQTSDVERQAFTLTFLADLYQLSEKDSLALKKLDTAQALYESIGH